MQHQANRAARLPFPVSNICFGTSPLGSMPASYGHSVDDDQARATIGAMLELDPCFIDTSRNYGRGRSEERLGAVIREMGGLPPDCILATKIDRDFETNRMDAARVRQSFEESLKALNLDRVPILHIHDPEHCADLGEVKRKGGAIDELFRLKRDGLVDAVGLAMGNLSLMAELIRGWEFDALLTHNRFTLLNRQADQLLTEAHQRGIAVFNAAPFAGGVLAKGSATAKRITYEEVSDEKLAPVRAVEEICARYQIPTGAAALQFSMRDPRITATILGVSRPERIAQAIEWAQWPVPEVAWEELLALPFSTEDPEAWRARKQAASA